MIYFAFDTGIKYDCITCNGLCCNINGTLSFTESQLKKIKNIAYMVDFIRKGEGGHYLIKTPKKCWFLSDKKCSLKDDTKPLICKLYPYTLWRLTSEIIICEICPCPEMSYINENETTVNSIGPIVDKYIREIGVDYHQYVQKILDSKYIDIKEQLHNREFLRRQINAYCDSMKERKEMFVIRLFTQLAFHPVLFNLNDTEINEMFKYYRKLTGNLFELNYTNIQNIYCILREATIKKALSLFYRPKNPSFITQIEHQFSSEGTLFMKLYHDPLTKWIKL